MVRNQYHRPFWLDKFRVFAYKILIYCVFAFGVMAPSLYLSPFWLEKVSILGSEILIHVLFALQMMALSQYHRPLWLEDFRMYGIEGPHPWSVLLPLDETFYNYFVVVSLDFRREEECLTKDLAPVGRKESLYAGNKAGVEVAMEILPG